MIPLFAQSELGDLMDKVKNGERLRAEDGLRLMNSRDILTLGYMADLVRKRKNGRQTLFRVHHSINSSDHGSLFKDDEKTVSRTYGRQTAPKEWISELIKLRENQDKNKQILAFSPIPLFTGEEELSGSMGVSETTGYEDLKMLAVSRIILDNVDHIRVFWVMLGAKLAQVSLNFGADDLEGVESEQCMNNQSVIRLIQKAGFDPIERDEFYEIRQ